MLDQMVTGAPFVVLLALVVVGGIALFVSWKQRRAGADLGKLLGTDIIMSARDANLAENTADRNVRGNGMLALSPSELAFRDWDGHSLRIPLPSIEEIEGTRLTMGGKPMRPLLKVRFADDQGEHQTVGWLVADAESWVSRIEELRMERS